MKSRKDNPRNRAGRNDRTESRVNTERKDRHERKDQTERRGRTEEKTERKFKTDHNVRTERKGRTEEKAERKFSTESKARNDHKGKTEPRVKRKGRPEHKTRTDRPDKTGKAERKEHVAQPGKDGLIRLNRYIANAGVCSRREADSFITLGEVRVNGKVVTELGTKVQLSDKVTFKGKVLNPEKPVYVLLNKPKNFITTTDDPDERNTVMQLVANACKERIYPVGRLDRNTTGLLLLTNDGELADTLAHPSNKVKKLYQVDIDRPISDADFFKIQEGVRLEDGLAQVDEIGLVNDSRKSLGLQIHIGRNRIVRRIFEHLGYKVVRLDRVMYAGLTKKDLPRGHWRHLTSQEIIKLKYLSN
ncbi:MAG: pseudouridine synthase [Cyclobacteriaceae bacterium]